MRVVAQSGPSPLKIYFAAWALACEDDLVFSSISFLFYFLPIFMVAYFVAPGIRVKNLVVVLFSLLFYAWGEPWFVAILILSIAGNSLAAIILDASAGRSTQTNDGGHGRGELGASDPLQIYLVPHRERRRSFPTFRLPVSHGPAASPPRHLVLHIPQPVLYHRCLSAAFPGQSQPVEVALYISLFPQLIAGPIVRYKSIARQLHLRRHTLGRASAGAGFSSSGSPRNC